MLDSQRRLVLAVVNIPVGDEVAHCMMFHQIVPSFIQPRIASQENKL